jgi:O-antigen ligase
MISNINTNILFKVFIIFISLLALMSPIDNEYSPISLKSAIGIPFIVMFFMAWLYQLPKKFSISNSSLYLPVAGFYLWAVITLFWVVNYFFATIMLLQFLSYVLTFVIVLNLVKNMRDIKFLMLSMLFVSLIVSIIGLIQFYFSDNEFIYNFFTQGAAPGSTFGNKNFTMHFIVMMIPLALMSLFIEKSRWLQCFFALSLFLNLWIWIVSFTRAAWLAVFIQIVFLLLILAIDKFKNKSNSMVNNLFNVKQKIIILFGVFFLLFVVIQSINQQTNKVVDTTMIINKIGAINMASGSARIPGWLNTIEMIKDHPIAGVGVGQWPIYYPLYNDRVALDTIFTDVETFRHLHNEFLEMFANFGFLGYVFLLWIFVIFVSMVLKILKSSHYHEKIYVVGIALSLQGFLIESFFSFPIKAYYPVLIVAILLATTSCIYNFIDE